MPAPTGACALRWPLCPVSPPAGTRAQCAADSQPRPCAPPGDAGHRGVVGRDGLCAVAGCIGPRSPVYHAGHLWVRSLRLDMSAPLLLCTASATAGHLLATLATRELLLAL
ncbi:unnamed protein product [Urochloa humidicola]